MSCCGHGGQNHVLLFKCLDIALVQLLFQLFEIRHVPAYCMSAATVPERCRRQADPLNALTIWDTIPNTYFCQFATGSP